MIYQEGSKFKVFPFKAIVGIEEHFISDKVQFEKDLKIISDMNEEESTSVTYENVSLTTEQQERFNKITMIQGVTLDEVREYVVSSVKPSNASFLIKEVMEENKIVKMKLDAAIDRNQFLEDVISEIVGIIY